MKRQGPESRPNATTIQGVLVALFNLKNNKNSGVQNRKLKNNTGGKKDWPEFVKQDSLGQSV